jgi:hypothetical protein
MNRQLWTFSLQNHSCEDRTANFYQMKANPTTEGFYRLNISYASLSGLLHLGGRPDRFLNLDFKRISQYTTPLREVGYARGQLSSVFHALEEGLYFRHPSSYCLKYVVLLQELTYF